MIPAWQHQDIANKCVREKILPSNFQNESITVQVMVSSYCDYITYYCVRLAFSCSLGLLWFMQIISWSTKLEFTKRVLANAAFLIRVFVSTLQQYNGISWMKECCITCQNKQEKGIYMIHPHVNISASVTRSGNQSIVVQHSSHFPLNSDKCCIVSIVMLIEKKCQAPCR